MKTALILLFLSSIFFVMKPNLAAQYSDTLCIKEVEIDRDNSEGFYDCTTFTVTKTYVIVKSEETFYSERITLVESDHFRANIWTEDGHWIFYLNGNKFDRVEYMPKLGNEVEWSKDNYKRL